MLLLSSCREEEIRTYRVAADASTRPGFPPSGGPSSLAAWEVSWQAPSEWQEEKPAPSPGARFRVGASGQISVTRLGGDGGGVRANVNRWRKQVGLPPLLEAEISERALRIEIGSDSILVFEAYPQDENSPTDGILGGILPLRGETWFFKFSAPAQVLREHYESFIEFLRKVVISPLSNSLAGAAGEEVRPVPKLDYTTPDGWEPSRGSAMRAASFLIAGTRGGEADFAVIPFPGDVGSPLENVNRWRKQLRLAPLETDPEDTIEGASGKFIITHLVSAEPLFDNGAKAAISGAILTKADYTWFFKMTGDSETVQENREKFEAFVRTAVIPDP